jgi:hypothetical protein
MTAKGRILVVAAGSAIRPTVSGNIHAHDGARRLHPVILNPQMKVLAQRVQLRTARL